MEARTHTNTTATARTTNLPATATNKTTAPRRGPLAPAPPAGAGARPPPPCSGSSVGCLRSSSRTPPRLRERECGSSTGFRSGSRHRPPRGRRLRTAPRPPQPCATGSVREWLSHRAQDVRRPRRASRAAATASWWPSAHRWPGGAGGHSASLRPSRHPRPQDPSRRRRCGNAPGLSCAKSSSECGWLRLNVKALA